jgi:DNA polymerase III alpha subunit
VETWVSLLSTPTPRQDDDDWYQGKHVDEGVPPVTDKIPPSTGVGYHISDQEAQAFMKAWSENGQNATAAYCATRNPPITEVTSAVKGRVTVYMKGPTISKLVAEAKKKAAKKIEGVLERYAISEARIAEELAYMAFTRTSDVIEWDKDGVRVRDSAELDPKVAAAIAEVSEYEDKNGNKMVRVKMADKKAALEALAKYRGMFTERRETTNKNISVQLIVDKSSGDAKINRAIDVTAKEIENVQERKSSH